MAPYDYNVNVLNRKIRKVTFREKQLTKSVNVNIIFAVLLLGRAYYELTNNYENGRLIIPWSCYCTIYNLFFLGFAKYYLRHNTYLGISFLIRSMPITMYGGIGIMALRNLEIVKAIFHCLIQDIQSNDINLLNEIPTIVIGMMYYGFQAHLYSCGMCFLKCLKFTHEEHELYSSIEVGWTKKQQ